MNTILVPSKMANSDTGGFITRTMFRGYSYHMFHIFDTKVFFVCGREAITALRHTHLADQEYAEIIRLSRGGWFPYLVWIPFSHDGKCCLELDSNMRPITASRTLPLEERVFNETQACIQIL